MDNPLVWVDLEMTGLDPDNDHIVEIAVIVTDGALERVEEGPDVVIHQPPEVLQAMPKVVRSMHAGSGLLEAVQASQHTVGDAEREVLDFVRTHVPDTRGAPLAGNTVHVDRVFLQRHMPALDRHLHYRHVDVSTIKELARRWYPQAYEQAPVKEGDHRALADIRESIDELRHYRATVFRAPG